MDQLFDAADPEKSLVSRLGILVIDLTRRTAQSDWHAAHSFWRDRARPRRRPHTPETGLQTGDVIHSLNITPITSMDELRAAVQHLKVGDPVVLQVERTDGLTYLSFEME